MRQQTYAEARDDAVVEIMRRDPRVFIIGQPFLSLERRKNVIVAEFGRDRLWSDVPISEIGYVGAAIGAALVGLRPIVGIGTGSFVFNAWPQIVNEMPHFSYLTNGQLRVPLLLHCNAGARGAGAAQHSHSPEAMLMNTPGLKIIAPSSARDVKGLLRSAMADGGPVVFIDHTLLHDVTGPVPDEEEWIPLGLADVKREGREVTIVAVGVMVQRALEAASQLAQEGIAAEVVDLRTLAPLDVQTVVASVQKTGRLVTADETQRTCGVGAEICARVVEQAADALKSFPVRVATPDCPIPFSPPLEARVVPQVQTIVEACRQVLGG